MIKQMFSPAEQAKAFGAFGPVMGLGAVGGPILAGWLVDADLFGWGWRTIFAINIPIVLITLALVTRVMAPARPRPAEARMPDQKTATSPATTSAITRAGSSHAAQRFRALEEDFIAHRSGFVIDGTHERTHGDLRPRKTGLVGLSKRVADAVAGIAERLQPLHAHGGGRAFEGGVDGHCGRGR